MLYLSCRMVLALQNKNPVRLRINIFNPDNLLHQIGILRWGSRTTTWRRCHHIYRTGQTRGCIYRNGVSINHRDTSRWITCKGHGNGRIKVRSANRHERSTSGRT